VCLFFVSECLVPAGLLIGLNNTSNGAASTVVPHTELSTLET
jgi:hypothetical protein